MNLKTTLIKMYRSRNSKKLLCEMRVTKYDHFTLDWSTQSRNHLWRTNTRTARFGSESIANLGAKTWKLIPEERKASKTSGMFKIPQGSSCRICKTHVNEVGFIDS